MYKELTTYVGAVNFGFNSTTGTNFKASCTARVVNRFCCVFKRHVFELKLLDIFLRTTQ